MRAAGPPVVVRQLANSAEFAAANRRHAYVIAAVLTRVGVRHHHARFGPGWNVPNADVDNAMAALEADGHRIELTL